MDHSTSWRGWAYISRANLGASATVASTAHNFVSWGTKRSDWRTTCVIDGDENYAASVLDTINII